MLETRRRPLLTLQQRFRSLERRHERAKVPTTNLNRKKSEYIHDGERVSSLLL